MRLEVLSFVLTLPLVAFACLLPEERGGGQRRFVPRQVSATGIEIGTGDRFKGGTIAPRGWGTLAQSIGTILSVDEIASGLKGLETEYGISLFNTPFKTYEGRSITVGKVGGQGKCNNAYRVFLNANIHARERGAADGLIYFIGDLLYANKTGGSLQYGSKAYTNAQVKTALSAGIIFSPLANPDGVAHDQKNDDCWRKNRNLKSAKPGNEYSVGVDLNRNYDFMWDYEKFFANMTYPASDNPAAEDFYGTGAFSEPETSSIKWVMDTFSKVRWFLDLHSYTGDVLYGWGDDDEQSVLPTMNFHNSSYNGLRGKARDTNKHGGYAEYIPAHEKADNTKAAKRIGSAINAATNRGYKVIPSFELYATSGTSTDYAFSRHLADPTKNLIHGYVLEFGLGAPRACKFYPSYGEHNANMKEIGAALMELVLAGSEIGLGDEVAC